MNEIDAYINGFSGEIKERLISIRNTIQETAPQLTERICMRMPTFDLNGKWLLHFAAFKKHISFFPQANGVAAFCRQVNQIQNIQGHNSISERRAPTP